jgi:hypothetical protein
MLDFVDKQMGKSQKSQNRNMVRTRDDAISTILSLFFVKGWFEALLRMPLLLYKFGFCSRQIDHIALACTWCDCSRVTVRLGAFRLGIIIPLTDEGLDWVVIFLYSLLITCIYCSAHKSSYIYIYIYIIP